MNTSELQLLIDKVKNKTATKEEIALFSKMMDDAMQEADTLLDQLTKEN